MYLNRQPNPRKKLLVPCVLDKPNPKCYVCRENPEVAVKLNPEHVTIRTLQDKVMFYTEFGGPIAWKYMLVIAHSREH